MYSIVLKGHCKITIVTQSDKDLLPLLEKDSNKTKGFKETKRL